MFTTIYRWHLHPQRELDFAAHWQRTTVGGLAGGSAGSSAFRHTHDIWVAIARWPSRVARDPFFAAQDDRNADPLVSSLSGLGWPACESACAAHISADSWPMESP